MDSYNGNDKKNWVYTRTLRGEEIYVEKLDFDYILLD